MSDYEPKRYEDWLSEAFERIERRLQIMEDRIERHLKPPFPPGLEALEKRIKELEGWVESLSRRCDQIEGKDY